MERQGFLPESLMVALVFSLMSMTPAWVSAKEDATLSTVSPPTIQAVNSRLPLSFEVNQGQWDSAVQFAGRGYGLQMFFTSAEAVLAIETGHSIGEHRIGSIVRHQRSRNPTPTTWLEREETAEIDAQEEFLLELTYDARRPALEQISKLGMYRLLGR